MAKIQIPITLELNERSIALISSNVEGDAAPANKVEAFVTEVLAAIVKGAMIMPADAVDKLRDIDPDLDNPEAIIEAVEKITGQSQGEYVITWPVDPALTEPLKQRAEMNGCTVQQLIKNMMDEAVAQGWFYDLAAKLRVVFLSEEETEEVATLLGTSDFTSQDILAALREANEPLFSTEEELEEQKVLAPGVTE